MLAPAPGQQGALGHHGQTDQPAVTSSATAGFRVSAQLAFARLLAMRMAAWIPFAAFSFLTCAFCPALRPRT